MALTKIKTYPQDRPSEWLKENPQERWRCDIFPGDGSDHHGIGATEAEAIFNASLAYRKWTDRKSRNKV
jgi:hypothetical protein